MKGLLQENQYQPPTLRRKLLLLTLTVLASIPSTWAAAFQPNLQQFIGPTNARRWDAVQTSSRPYFGMQKSAINQPKGLGIGKKKDDVGEKEETPSQKIRSAAAFVVLQLQLTAAEKLAKQEEKGEVDVEKQEQLLKLMELTMGGSSSASAAATETPPSTKSSSTTADSSSSAPSSSRQAEIDKKKTQKILDDLDNMMKPTSETKAPVAAPASVDTSKKSDTPTKEETAKLDSKANVAEKKAGTEEVKDSKTDSTTKTEGKTSTKSNSNPNLPACVSTEFGQALPIVAEGLPPLRKPLVASEAPSSSTKKIDATQLIEPPQSATKEKESSVATLEKPVQTVADPPTVDSSAPTSETDKETTSPEAVAPLVSEPVAVQPTEAENKKSAAQDQPGSTEKLARDLQKTRKERAMKVEKTAASEEKQDEESSEYKPKLRFPPTPKSEPEKDGDAPPLSVDTKKEEESSEIQPKLRFPPTPKSSEPEEDADDKARILVPPPPKAEPETKESQDAPSLAVESKEKKEPEENASTPTPTTAPEAKASAPKAEPETKESQNTPSLAFESKKKENEPEEKAATPTPTPTTAPEAKAAAPQPTTELEATLTPMTEPETKVAVSVSPKAPSAPKTDEELSKHYASMPLGERAFAILVDLGMIECTPDPDDPDYDHTKDDEICADIKWKDQKS